MAGRSLEASEMLSDFKGRALWPPIIPSPVLIECLQGHAGRDAEINRFLKSCDILEHIDATLVRRAGHLRTRAGRGSAVDALVVAAAEPGGTVLTSDFRDLGALAAYANDVVVLAI